MTARLPTTRVVLCNVNIMHSPTTRIDENDIFNITHIWEAALEIQHHQWQNLNYVKHGSFLGKSENILTQNKEEIPMINVV